MPVNADKVEFEELPARRTRSGKVYPSRWVKRLEPFKSRPGEWGRIGTPAKYSTLLSRSRTLKLGEAKGVDPAEWEFQIRSPEPDGKDNYYLYVRYVGAKAQEPAQAAPQADAQPQAQPNTELADMDEDEWEDESEVAEV